MALSGNLRTENSTRKLTGTLPGTLQFGVPGYTPVRGVDYWTEEDKAEILSQVQPLAQEQIELLNALLIQDTLICFPEITATHRSRMGYDEETGHNTHIIEVEATITDIDKTLIQKVEIGRSYLFGTITEFEWFDTDITLGDTTHTLSYSEEKPYATNYNGIYVRLTYYSLIGGINELTVKAVYAE
jgi:hypothetical protein